MNLKEFVEKNEFSQVAGGFPEGKTVLDIERVEVETHEFVDERTGKSRFKYLLHDPVSNKTYWAGNVIMQGVKDALKYGAKQVEIIRSGQGLQTKYLVLPVNTK